MYRQRDMYGLTRGVATLVGAGVAGLLIWAATRVAGPTVGDYWGLIGLAAAAGLVLALSQLVGGWTKWGRPRISLGVLLVGFLPTLIAAGWIIVYSQPSANWFQHHFNSWSGDIGVGGFAHEIGRAAVLLAFGLGIVFGFVFDTTGPDTEPVSPTRRRRRRGGEAQPAPTDGPPTTEEPAREPTADTAETEATSDADAATRVNRPAEPVGTRQQGEGPGSGP